MATARAGKKVEAAAPARRAVRPARDLTDRFPNTPPEDVEQGQFEVVPIQDGFDGWVRRPQGVAYTGTFPIDKDGNPILHPWLVLKDDYDPEAVEGINLPATKFDRRLSPGVQGRVNGRPINL